MPMLIRDRRSPLDRMIDEATGYDPSKAPWAPPPRDREAETEALTKTLLAVADAAKSWHRAKPHNRADRERALHTAAKAWIEAGG